MVTTYQRDHGEGRQTLDVAHQPQRKDDEHAQAGDDQRPQVRAVVDAEAGRHQTGRNVANDDEEGDAGAQQVEEHADLHQGLAAGAEDVVGEQLVVLAAVDDGRLQQQVAAELVEEGAQAEHQDGEEDAALAVAQRHRQDGHADDAVAEVDGALQGAVKGLHGEITFGPR